MKNKDFDKKGGDRKPHNNGGKRREADDFFGKPGQGERKGPYGKPPRREESGERKGPYGRPPRREESGERKGPYGRPPRREDAPVERRGPYGRPPQEEGYAPDAQREETTPILAGRNPIREAIKAGRDIDKLLVLDGELSGSARQIVAMAHEAGIVVQNVRKQRLDALSPGHQGMVAMLPAHEYADMEDIFNLAQERAEAPLVIVLDGVHDPHNLGAVIRTAEVAGAHGVVIPERRAAGLTAIAVKASAGAAVYLPVVRVRNITDTLESFKKRGLWIFGADMGGEDYAAQDYTSPMALVIGAEGGGISARVAKSCDKIIAVPVRGKVDSLNVSVATGVLLYKILENRGLTS